MFNTGNMLTGINVSKPVNSVIFILECQGIFLHRVGMCTVTTQFEKLRTLKKKIQFLILGPSQRILIFLSALISSILTHFEKKCSWFS